MVRSLADRTFQLRSTGPVDDDARVRAVLEQVELGSLAERWGLDAVEDWGRLLSLGEQLSWI